MRHGQAQMVAPTDAERMLTTAGEQETHSMSQWLAKLTTIEATFASPYVRAQQTREIMSENSQSIVNRWQLDELTPESDPASCGDILLAYCAQHKMDNALVVSHLPLVSLLITDLCPGAVITHFPPSSIACLDIDLDSWQGKLLWHKHYDDIAHQNSIGST